jgi:hypothetical protein
VLDATTDEGYDRELTRIVDRLRTMPLTRLEAIQPQVHDLARTLVALARDFGDPAPAPLPEFSARASADVVLVLGRDVRACATTDAQLAAAAACLTEARRALP